MAVPRVCGRTPMWRLRPALPTVTFWWSALPTTPTVARHSARTIRISPEGRRSVAMSPSLAISWMPAPAERPSWPPRPGWSSTLWTSGADRHVGQRQRVADRDVGAGARLHGHPDPQAVRGEDVAPSRRRRSAAARCTPSGSGRTRSRRPWPARRPCGALEVDLAVQPLGAAAAVARGLAAVRVAAAGLLETLDERLLGLGLRDLGEVRVGGEAAARAKWAWACGSALQAQASRPWKIGIVSPGAHLHDGLLPRPRAPGV